MTLRYTVATCSLLAALSVSSEALADVGHAEPEWLHFVQLNTGAVSIGRVESAAGFSSILKVVYVDAAGSLQMAGGTSSLSPEALSEITSDIQFIDDIHSSIVTNDAAFGMTSSFDVTMSSAAADLLFYGQDGYAWLAANGSEVTLDGQPVDAQTVLPVEAALIYLLVADELDSTTPGAAINDTLSE